MRKIIVSIHSTFNGIVTGPPADKTNFMIWAQDGIKESVQAVSKLFDTVDTILLGRGTYEMGRIRRANDTHFRQPHSRAISHERESGR